MDKSWDHPWTTEEIRRKRNEWTLAGDAGLLKHLQQFSENLMSKAVKTQETLNSLTAQLDETAIFIDNITNSSLALANTQFIESRVYEDDVEVAKLTEPENQEMKNKEQLSAELIANVGESVRQGLCVMDEKYEQLEVVASDSEDEEEPAVPSIILRPKDPYQDRPLPYIIGSEKWKASSKIGLESSSSESEQLDEEDSESESDEKSREFILNSNNRERSMMDAISSSSSEPNDFNIDNVSIKHEEKMDVKAQDTINSDSESTTVASSVPRHMGHAMPSFAEELAKRLGNVLPTDKSINTHVVDNPEVDQPNNDDIFASKYDDIFSTRSKNLFDNDDKLFDEDVPAPTDSSRYKPIKTMKSSVIPPSSDIPPPMSSISAKPKSAIDDLFGDADSEDSNDIFSSKSSTKKVVKKNTSTTSQPFHDNIKKRLLTVDTVDNTGNMATSTPETIVDANNLFGDEDDNDLFGTPKRQNDSSRGTPKTEASNVTKKKPVGGVPILMPGNILASEIGSKLRSRLSSSDSSDSNATENNEGTSSSNQINQDATSSSLPSVNFSEPSLPVAAGNLESSMRGTETSGSSGISIYPPSFNSTTGSGLGADFHPQMSSSRLRSEEIYRERVISDSLFVVQPHKAGSGNSENTTNPLREERTEETSEEQDDVFDNEDVFGPPPLPKAESKTKSKTISLFDDSDSGDDLFSNTSSGSRSQKSADLLVTIPQTLEKPKPLQKNNLFDDDNNIFTTKDSPDVDIFSIGSKTLPQENYSANKAAVDSGITSSKNSGENNSEKASSSKAPWTKSFLKPSSIFDDSDDDEDLFGANFGKKKQKDSKPTNALKVNETEDLFSMPPKINIEPEKKETLSTSYSENITKENLVVEKEVITDTSKRVETESEESNKVTTMDSLHSRGSLFDDIDNDDVDDLFGQKKTIKPKPSNGISAEISQNNIPELFSKSKDIKEPEIINEDSKHIEKIDIIHHSILPDTKITTLESTEDSESSSSDAVSSIKESEPLKKNTSGFFESTNSDDLFAGNSGNSRREPPKTLSIRPPVSPTNEETVAPKRAVSGKIKDLMGRMGDLKILSPTDPPSSWKKNDERNDELDIPDDKDIGDGGCISTAKENPQVTSEEYAQSKPSVQSKPMEREDDEVAVSFDEPAQVGTLAATASKSRIRIQAKRRPQSRHARQSALRQSGIDFNTVDITSGNPDNNQTEISSNEQNATIISSTDRLIVPGEGEENLNRGTESNLTADDKSERSLSKESSMSINKNTLLSPSTDEEDLFDVPPDLPEDPQKEDLLFGRAPILSPVENVISSNRKSVQTAKSTLSRSDDFIGNKVEREDISKDKQKETDVTHSHDKQQFSAEIASTLNQKLDWKEASLQDNKGKEMNSEKKIVEADNNLKKDDEQIVEEGSIDPLHDNSHDPLKDPSQLFAFVTKTPSPEKGQNLLFNEDDSLFTSISKKTSEIPSTATKKQTLDLFADDIGGDLFSAPLTKSVKKPLKDTKISLFDDDGDEDDADSDNLFSSFSKSKPVSKSAPVVKEVKITKPTEQITTKQNILFEGDDENLFGTQSTKMESSESSKVAKTIIKTSNLKDIFGDQSSGEDDIFAIKKPVTKTIAPSNSVFTYDDDGDDDIFGKSSFASTSQTRTIHNQSTVKKSVTRDLRKTAEKIVEDPLSLLQKD